MDTSKNASTPNFLEKTWVKYGLIGGFIAIAITTIYYVFDKSLLLHPVLNYLPWFSIALVSVFTALELKRNQHNFLAFSQAVTISLGSFAVGLVLMIAFSLLLYFVIDPKLMHDFTQSQIQALSDLVSSNRLSRSSFETLQKQIIEKASDLYIYQLALISIIASIAALIIFLISSAILRREPNTQI